jgi:hypothetical protein
VVKWLVLFHLSQFQIFIPPTALLILVQKGWVGVRGIRKKGLKKKKKDLHTHPTSFNKKMVFTD